MSSTQLPCVLPVDADVPDTEDDDRDDQDDVDLVDGQEQKARYGQDGQGYGTGPKLR
jgi:hypothetical protein